MTKPKLPAKLSFLKSRPFIIAAVIAVGVIAAVSTFASGGPQLSGSWSADGSAYKECRPAGACVKSAGSVQSSADFAADYLTRPMSPGQYKLNLNYRTTGTAPGYEPLVRILLNGKPVDQVRLTPSQAKTSFISDSFEVKHGGKERRNLVTVRWDNAPAGSANLVVSNVALRQVRGQYQKGSSAYWADMLLREADSGKNARIQLNAETKRDLNRIRDGRCTKTELGTCVKVDRRVLSAVYEVSRKRRLYIWHFTGGPHVSSSNHYRGEAVDLREWGGKNPIHGTRKPLGWFKALGADELLGPGDYNHTDHWHVAWE